MRLPVKVYNINNNAISLHAVEILYLPSQSEVNDLKNTLDLVTTQQ